MICFFSGVPIDSFDPLDVAIIHNNNSSNSNNMNESNQGKKCMCSLKLLVAYLYDIPKERQRDNLNQGEDLSKFLPTNGKIESIYDGISYALTYQNNDNDVINSSSSWKKHYDIVSFKFNKQSYHLSILKEEEGNKKGHGLNVQVVQNIREYWRTLVNSTSTQQQQHPTNYEKYGERQEEICTETIAQRRISTVLGIDLNHMKILHKGKVVFPQKDMGKDFTNDTISKELIQISNLDKKRKSPSLVVIGTRSEDLLIDRDKVKHSFSIDAILKGWRSLTIEKKRYVIAIGSGILFFTYFYWMRRNNQYVSDDDFFEL